MDDLLVIRYGIKVTGRFLLPDGMFGARGDSAARRR